MADYSTYHSQGQGEQLDPNDPNRTSQPAPPQFQPPMAGQPYQQQQQQQQQQPGMGYGAPAPQQQQYYGGPSPIGDPQQSQGYYGGTGGQLPPPQDPSLPAQMGAMSLGGEVAHHGRKKKKDRHAFHSVEPQGSSPAFNSNPQQGASASQFLNADVSGGAPGPGAPSPQYIGGVAPQDAQFPAPVNPMFSPGPPASPMEFAARQADPGTAPAFVPAGGQGRVDPDELPSIPVSRDSVQPHYLANVYATFERHVPPPASISFLAHDQSNSSPKCARLTTNNIPNTAEGLSSTGIPLGLVLQPLAPLLPGELEVPVLDFGDQGPPRCRRCRAYINPFMLFRGGGNKYVCNLCTYPSDTPSEYFCATTPQGVRVDRDQRPELCRGTVEFIVPKEYWTKPPVGIRWLFLIDVTQEAINKGFLEAFCQGILSTLYENADGGEGEAGKEQRSIPIGAKVGFVTFDKDIHFYNINPALEQAQMMIMPDIEDPFVPLHDGLFVDPYEAQSVITSLLSRIPTMFASIKNPEPAVLSTLNSALSALEETGGKIICSLSALSTWGPGRLFLRDDGKYPGGEMDKKLYTTDHPNWRKVAERMVSAGVGIDFFLAAPQAGFLDIATIGHVSSTTGGETFYYPNFVGGRDNAKLSQEMKHAVTRQTGFQALMKVRCSNGLQISNYYGNFVQHTFGADLEIGVIDADKAIGVTFSYDGKLDSKLDAHFQAALLYTTASGERRVRCINSIASVTENAKDAMKFVDQDAVVSIIAKDAAAKLGSTSSTLKDIRQGITERNIDVLANYRKNFSSQSHPPGQLVMPEKLKEFSMYMLCLLKCRAFKAGNETADRRVQEMRMIREMGALELSLYLYPRMIPIHNLDPEEGFPDPETGHLKLPPSTRASFQRVDPGGVYLVDNGQQCLLWMHTQTSPNLISDLFGQDKTNLQSLDLYTSSIPVLETHLNAQVRNIIAFLQTVRGSKALTIQLARQGIDGAEFEFANRLVEDRNNEAQSYVDWLVHLHKGVQLELTGQRKREGSTNDTISLTAPNFTGLRPQYW